MIRYRADWVLPISEGPIHEGWVALDDGRIAGVGSGRSGDEIDLGRVAILPALVNAHTHLELSYLHGRVPPRKHFTEWIAELIALRRRYPDPAAPEILDAARDAIRRGRATGTGLFGDISNTLITVPLLCEAGATAHVFYELLGFNVPDPGAVVLAARDRVSAMSLTGDVHAGIAPHAPYSVSPSLFGAIRADLDVGRGRITSVHLGESPEEVEFIRNGSGRFRDLAERLGVWTDGWRKVVPTNASPVGYLAEIGFLARTVLVVHGVQFDGEDLARLAAIGVTIVSCPRSNVHVGVGSPPLERFYAAGVPVAFGTDSLASVDSLDMFAELAEARRIAPGIAPRRLLESATRVGAEALGFGADRGTLEPGKRAALIAVTLPASTPDVEEYLVSGIDGHRIRWLNQQ